MKLNVKSFAFTCGLFWGAALFLLAWWVILLEGPTHDPTMIGRVYPGYAISPAGSFFGLIWGLPDGAICGAIFAWLYNRLSGQSMPQEG